jgi:hypothetical protein
MTVNLIKCAASALHFIYSLSRRRVRRVRRPAFPAAVFSAAVFFAAAATSATASSARFAANLLMRTACFALSAPALLPLIFATFAARRFLFCAHAAAHTAAAAADIVIRAFFFCGILVPDARRILY